MSVYVGVAKKAAQAAVNQLRRAPGTSALSETFMSKTSSYVSSSVASRMKWKLKSESVDDSVDYERGARHDVGEREREKGKQIEKERECPAVIR